MLRELRALAQPPAAAALLLGAFFCFGHLGGRGLWQDEAETAVLARRVRTYGVPRADDGVNAVSAELGRDRGADGVWNWSPWLPMYLDAAAFRIFGESEAAARLPFALAGWLCLPAVFLLSRRWFSSLWGARLSLFALTLSTPFLLAARQARGYALAALALMALLLAFDGLLRGRRRAALVFVAAALVLFYTNYLVALGLFAALALSTPLLKPDRAGARRLARAAAVVLLGAAPGLVYFHVFGRATSWNTARFFSQLGHGAVLLTAFVLPWPFVLGLLLSAGVRGDAPSSRRVRFLLAAIGLYLLILASAPWLFFRYLAVLAPVAAVLIGAALDRLRARSRLAAAVALTLLATDLYARVPLGLLGLSAASWADPGPAHSPEVGLALEILRGYPSCDKAAAAYIEERARPDDVVMTNYGDTVLQFYTPLRVRGGEQGPPWPNFPDWAVLHPYELSRDPGRDWSALQFLRGRVAPPGSGYALQPFVCRDPVLADAPDPGTHLFSPPRGGSSLLIFRRVTAAPIP
ncbi:MAG: hypothetical protein HKL90_06660 [Elusimicrobia bacterium]|nr:hypothetical protein [Elusimicrobiota bacterium]